MSASSLRYQPGYAVPAAATTDYAVDLRGARDKDEVLRRFAAALAFPAYFGGNWDAFADCLTDLDGATPDGYRLLVSGWSDFRAADPQGFTTLTEVLQAAATQWHGAGTTFLVLLLGGNDESG